MHSLIKRLVGLYYDRQNPYAYEIYDILNQPQDYNRFSNPQLARECDELFMRRWQTNRVAYRPSFWQSHFEVYGAEQSGLLAPDLRILDFGCGTGNVTLELAKRGYESTGIDLSPKAIKIANLYRVDLPNRVQERVNFVCDDIHSYKTSRPYDLFLLLHVVEHILDPTLLFDSLRRLASDHVKLWISVPLFRRHDDPSMSITSKMVKNLGDICSNSGMCNAQSWTPTTGSSAPSLLTKS